MKLETIFQILNNEIKWCEQNPDPAFHEEYRKGFINGLIQAKYLISEAERKSSWKEISDELFDEYNELWGRLGKL